MLTRFRLHFTQNVVAYLALFIALGGTSYGLKTGVIDGREIKNNTVHSRDIKNDTVRTRDLRNNDVRSRDIRNRTIVGRDVVNNALDGDQINESKLGQVPSALSADSALNAMSLGGIPAALIGQAPAASVNLNGGQARAILTLPGLGVLRVAPFGACDTTGEDVGIQVFNNTPAQLDVFSAPPASFQGGVDPGTASSAVELSGPPARLELRVVPAGQTGAAATVDVFFTMAAQGSECRLSAQAIVSG
jgi:hypothetical protein